jgi:chromosome segregation and condensation protein ScpB
MHDELFANSHIPEIPLSDVDQWLKDLIDSGLIRYRLTPDRGRQIEVTDKYHELCEGHSGNYYHEYN